MPIHCGLRLAPSLLYYILSLFFCPILPPSPLILVWGEYLISSPITRLVALLSFHDLIWMYSSGCVAPDPWLLNNWGHKLGQCVFLAMGRFKLFEGTDLLWQPPIKFWRLKSSLYYLSISLMMRLTLFTLNLAAPMAGYISASPSSYYLTPFYSVYPTVLMLLSTDKMSFNSTSSCISYRSGFALI